MEPSREQHPDLRASDADRQRVAEVIREAYAEGRLTYDEHSERIDRALTARTLGELVPLTADLPATYPGGQAVAVPAEHGRPVPGMPVGGTPHGGSAIAVFAGAERKGHWVVPDGMLALAVFGGVELDLTQAALAKPEVVINATAVFGGIDITVPEGVDVHVDTFAIFGGTSRPKDDLPLPPGAPVVRIRGFALFGGIDIKRPKRPKGARELRA